jgi:alkanesulfonate monooxygenase SsuD/methylene tetrahydromethanopterin reductase-like flavin-dependent oxidoreductase (luciferase family)
MRVGVSLASRYDVDDHAVGARWLVERAGAAAAAGVDHLSIGDHHAEPVPYYQNVPMLGRLLAEWPSERPAGCLFLVPLWHPVLMAEQIGTLAAIHGGPFIVQTGLGGGHRQFAAMGRAMDRRLGDLTEGIRVVQALLAGETVSSDRFGIGDATIAPRPPAAVEWWIGAGVPAAIERAARWSGTWYAGPNTTVDAGREGAEQFLAACAAAGRQPERLVIRQDVLVATSDAEAAQLAAPVLEAGYRGFGPELLAIGSVDTVAERFDAYAAAGFTDVSVRQITVPQSAALESIGLLGEVRAALAAR